MNTFSITIPQEQLQIFKEKMLNWISQFNIFCLLDSCNDLNNTTSISWSAAAGSKRSITITKSEDYKSLKDFNDEKPGFLFGHFNYDFGITENSGKQSNSVSATFPNGFFFEPEILLQLNGTLLTISSACYNTKAVYDKIQQGNSIVPHKINKPYPAYRSVAKTQYIADVTKLKAHIQRGDCYEINYCQHFYVNNISLEPIAVYQALIAASPVPFAALYRLNDRFCICASPERYLKKEGNMLTSQPIKGTSPRVLHNPLADEESKTSLLNSKKERSENVMVVDLVRNDLSKVCVPGSVFVKELFGLYSFQTVHQMISTICGTLVPQANWLDAIKATFPMGSMTGAPKKKVMDLIATFESEQRGLFSGAIGYITPNADFDFNVVIRSIFYDSKNQRASFYAGSGITFESIPEKEWEECELKIAAIVKVLQLDIE